MKSKVDRFVGISQLAKEYAITWREAYEALMYAGVRTPQGLPARVGFAQLRVSEGRKPWYAWHAATAQQAFKKAGIKKPTKLALYSQVHSRQTAMSRLEKSFAAMGIAAQLEAAAQNESSLLSALEIHQDPLSIIGREVGGRFATLTVVSKDEGAILLNRLRDVVSDFEVTCISLCTSKKRRSDVQFHASAIRLVADWIQKQIFK